jgi:hypothetical protein
MMRKVQEEDINHFSTKNLDRFKRTDHDLGEDT